MSDGGVSNGAREGESRVQGVHAVSYPPPAPSPSPAETSTYIIHTETDSITDLRLQISVEPKHPKDPLRPLFFRERDLSEQGEIVDSLVNASTAQVPWTIHKPARGWYLRLRSPALPPNTALPLRPPSRSQSAPTPSASSRSPLMVSLPTSIDMGWLSGVKETIDDIGGGAAAAPRYLHSRTQSAAHKKQDETRAHARAEGSIAPTILTDADGDGGERAGERSAATGVGTSSVVAAGSSGHTRRRSGGSGSHRIEVRKVSNEPREAGVREEAEDNEDLPIAGGSRLALSLHTQNLEPGPSTSSTNLLTPPAQSGGSGLGRDVLAGVSPGSAQFSSIDRPYSPTEPSSALDTPSTSSKAKVSVSNIANEGQPGAAKRANASTAPRPLLLRPGPPAGLSLNGQGRPLVCHFVLIDGIDPASYEARAPFLPGSGRRSRLRSGAGTNASAKVAGGATAATGTGSGLNALRRRWTGWAWGKIPSAIRPGSLPLDTNHDFSLHWVNPPVLQGQGEDVGGVESVEVLRFKDGSGGLFSGWNAARKGSVVMQEGAVRGLGLERAFWFGLVLAYLDFLESRDSYQAACEG